VSFLPQVDTSYHATRPISLLSLGHVSEGVRLLCVRRILKVYPNRSMTACLQASYADQLFITFGGNSPGSQVSKPLFDLARRLRL
jgi:hypothetical protein